MERGYYRGGTAEKRFRPLKIRRRRQSRSKDANDGPLESPAFALSSAVSLAFQFEDPDERGGKQKK